MNTILRNNKRVRKHFKLIPMRKIGATFDVANVVEFLASNKVIYFTGLSYLVDGGMHCTLVWCGVNAEHNIENHDISLCVGIGLLHDLIYYKIYSLLDYFSTLT